jgi:signal peptidase I
MTHVSLPRFSRSLWTKWLRPFLFAAAVVFPFKSAIADWNWVPTGLMRPTILEGELVLVNKLAYDLKIPFTTVHLAEWSHPARGDVAVCFSPHDGARLVKRVIALPGDRVALQGGRLIVNGVPLRYRFAETGWQKYATPEEQRGAFALEEDLGAHAHLVLTQPARPALRDFAEQVVPAGSYFMMGDNRDVSFDSRYFGVVPRREIIGRVTGTVLSFDPERSLRPRFSRWMRPLS